MSMTIDDIVRKMRKDMPRVIDPKVILRNYADRIEKAMEVERKEWRKMLKEAKDAIGVLEERRDAVEQCQTEEATCKESLQVGNAAKMRAALEAVVKVGYPHNFQREAPHIRGYCYEITTAIEKCFAALSAPPRNCDRQYQNGYDVLRQFTGETGCQIFNTVDVVNWLLAETKGGEK